MLEQKELDVLKNMMESVLEKSEESILSKVDERLANSENLLLEEMERTRSILDNKIERVQKNLDELSQHYRITKLENDNMALLLKMIEGLTKRVEELERKTA